jgi:O-antigen ligase
VTLALQPARGIAVGRGPGPAPAPAGEAEPQRTVALARPGFIEKVAVVITIFVLIHELPNTWFKTRADLLAEQSNPMAVLIGLGLMGLGIARVVGSIDYLITIVKAEVAAFTFVTITMASTFWSADAAETLEKSIVFATVSLYGAYLVLRFSLQDNLKLWSFVFCLSALANAAFSFGMPVYGRSSGGEMTGVFSQKNALGYYAALAIPVLIVAGRSWLRWRFVFYLAAVVWTVLLLGSQSKTMLLAALIPTILLAVYHMFRGRHTLRGAVLTSLFGSAAFTIFFATANIAVLARWLDKDVTLTGRVPMWESLLPIALERPLTGYGYKATFGGYFSPIHEVWIQSNWNPTHAHNAALQIVLEIGVFGLIAFLFCYFRAVGRAIKIVAIVPGAIGLWPMSFLTTTLLVSITESGMSSNKVGWLMFMVTVLSVSSHLAYRTSMGLSNDLHEVVSANSSVRRRSTPLTDALALGRSPTD